MIFQNHTMPRTTDWIDFYVDPLLESGERFVIQHGTYTTKIVTAKKKYVFTNAQFRERVFIAAAMVKKDCHNSGLLDEILANKHYRVNYSNTDSVTEYLADEIYNIDIKSAYATCLYQSGLICKKTFDYINHLAKEERLPAVGMLARSYVKYVYEHGKCQLVDSFKEPTAEVFYYLIQQIDLIMRDLKFILGQYFIFYWVDGIFFKKNTPRHLIQKVQDHLTELGYRYSYEVCREFLFENNDGNCRVLLVKDDELKDYRFADSQLNDRYLNKHLFEKMEKTLKKTHDEQKKN